MSEKTNIIQVKIFTSSSNKTLENTINNFLSINDIEKLESLHFSGSDRYTDVLITYYPRNPKYCKTCQHLLVENNCPKCDEKND